MNNKANVKISYLLIFSNYLLLVNVNQENHFLINELNETLNDILRIIQRKLLAGEFKKDDCQSMADQIDKLIYLSAELSQRDIKMSKNELNNFKEIIWYLLETLEAYCSKNFNLSVW